MTAQDATRARKNAKARREKKKQDDGSNTASVRSDRGGASAAAPQGSYPERLVRYWKGIYQEMKRVAWPSKPELIAGTLSSIFILMVFAGWLGGLDWFLMTTFG